MDRRERMGDLEVVIRAALEGFQSNLWTASPGIVQSFNAGAITAEVQPSIQGQVRLPNGTWQIVNLPLCVDCPVQFVGGGGFFLTSPITNGDEGLLVFASRCIDAWWQQGGVQTQAELRMHDLSDGFFIPGFFSQPKVLPNVSLTSTQLRNRVGDTYVEVATGQIVNIVAPGGFEVTGPTTFNGPVTFLGVVNGEGGGSGTVNFGSANLLTTGTSTAEDHLSSGISGSGHKHGGVQTGSGDTGTPV